MYQMLAVALVLIAPAAWAASPDILEMPASTITLPASMPSVGQVQTLHGDIMQVVLPPADDATTHRLVIWCTDDTLIYAADLFVAASGAQVYADSIRLNGVSLDHTGYTSDMGLRVDVADTLGSPAVLTDTGSLMIPIQVRSGTPATLASLEIVYVSGRNSACHLDIFEPQPVGLLFPSNTDFGNFAGIMLASTQLGITDFNAYLTDTGADWQLETVMRDPNTENIRDIVDELVDDNITAYLGPPYVSGLQRLALHNPDVISISCCGTSSFLDVEDRTFRTAPSDSALASQLARLLIYNDIRVLLPVWVDDDWNDSYRDDVIVHFERLGGIVDEGIGAQPSEGLASKAEDIRDRIESLVSKHGADSVAVFSLPFEDLPFLEAMAAQEGADTVRWFGTDYTARDSRYLTSDTAEPFVSATGYTALQVPSMLADAVRAELTTITGKTANHDMLAAYESAWIMGLAIQHTQSMDPERLADAIPRVAQWHFGTLGPMMLDSNGDLASATFEVWSVHDGQWVLAGIIQ